VTKVFHDEIGKRIEDCTHKGISEWDTASLFVEPVLRELGWDTFDISQVCRESRRGWQLGDMQLLVKVAGQEPRLAAVIEIKSLDHRILSGFLDGLYEDIKLGVLENHDHWNYTHRLSRSIDDAVFVHGVVTNGQHWKIFDLTSRPGSASLSDKQREPLCDVSLSSTDWESPLRRALGRPELKERVDCFLAGNDAAK
jgi:hypothetical protein